MNSWQPIETAPKDGTRVLCWTRPQIAQAKVGIARWHQPGNPAHKGFWTVEGGSSNKVTHWQPLPEPPTE